MSLKFRALVSAGLILVCFLGLTGITLDRAFVGSAEESVRQRLEAHLYGLLALAEPEDDGAALSIRGGLTEERFGRPGSGLYAAITADDRQPDWQSPSLIGHAFRDIPVLAAGERRFERVTNERGIRLYAYSMGVAWENDGAPARRYTFTVAESPDSLNAQVAGFRHSLWGGLAAVVVLLLGAQGLLLRWILAPVMSIERDLAGIRDGSQEKLVGTYPPEIHGLTESLNRLLDAQRDRLGRYREALGNLAHSLKTPLAVITGAAGDDRADLRGTVVEQSLRMRRIVDYHLQRAATFGHTPLARTIAVAPLIERIAASLQKIHSDRHIRFALECDPDLGLAADESDLMEVLGNVMDNAFKWCDQQVRVSAARRRTMVRIDIEDDGPGIPVAISSRVLDRGWRDDGERGGQGIGLDVTRDIVHSYQGTIAIAASELGGARIRIEL